MKHSVSTPAGLARVKATYRPGDRIVFAAVRWQRLVLDAWHDVTFAARAGATFAGFEVMPDVERLVLDSLEVTQCDGIGVQLRRDGDFGPSMTILNPNFHHSQYNLISGTAGGTGVIVKGGYLGDVDRPGCDAKNCPELWRVLGGGPWLFDSIRLGPAAPNGPLVRTFPQSEYPLIHDLTVQNCVGSSTVHNQSGIDTEGSSRIPPRFPVNVVYRNNTIWTSENAFGFGSSWENCPVAERPVVANNICKFQGGDQCARARFFSNLAERTRGDCGAGVTVGKANLDSEFRPTAQSTFVLNRADPAYSPPLDFYGLPRVGLPDRGAIERR